MMSVAPRPDSDKPYPARGAKFIPRTSTARDEAFLGGGARGGPGAASSAGLAGAIGGIAAPLLCLGCLSALALLGLFGTMIGAAAYMNAIQRQIRKNLNGAGTTIEANFFVLFCALFCSIYVLTKHRRGANST